MQQADGFRFIRQIEQVVRVRRGWSPGLVSGGDADQLQTRQISLFGADKRKHPSTREKFQRCMKFEAVRIVSGF